MLRRTLTLASLLVLIACDKKEAAPTSAGAAQAATSAAASVAVPAKDAPASAPAPVAGSSAALSHLPSNCDTIARIDLAKVLAVPAVKSQLAPALEETVFRGFLLPSLTKWCVDLSADHLSL